MYGRLEVASFAYHEVTDDPTSSGFQRRGAAPYRLTPEAFGAHLDRIAESPVAPGLVTAIDFERPGRHLLLTLDDGGRSAMRVSDALCARGWRAHFFIVTGLIGSRTFLGREDIAHLRACGHVVGSHSHRHPDIFRELSPARMREEWRVSTEILSDLLGEPCTAGAVPGGDISPAVLESASAAGLRYLFTSEPVLVPSRVGHCHVLGRVTPRAGSQPQQVKELAAFVGWGRERFVRRAKGALRACLPGPYRLYVHAMTGAHRVTE